MVIAKIASSASLPAAASSRTWSSYRSPSESALAKIVGLVVTPTTELFFDQVREVPGLDALAGQVVQPDGYACVGQGLESIGHRVPPGSGRGSRQTSVQSAESAMLPSAANVTASAVIPNSR